MQQKEIKAILEKVQSGNSTPEEEAIAKYWLHQLKLKEQTNLAESDLENVSQEMWHHILEKQRQVPKVRSLWPRVAAAASILVLLGTGTYFILSRQKKVDYMSTVIAPYSSMAVLKSGGKTILLDKTANGKIAKTMVTKASGEQLSYDRANESLATVYDTIQIPAGGRPYTVGLTDGTKITLNAATTLRYPETFSKNRKEEIELISGEIYASVIHHQEAPLTIRTPGQIITDVGTEFNISAYPDDRDARTTLAVGAVRVSAAGKEKILSLPGHQAIFTGKDLTTGIADLNQVLAWKNGQFRFNAEHIDDIMRELSRWYNIDVKYEGKITSEVFYGRVARKMNINEVLRILERSNKVYFKIEGRRVTVLSK